MESICGAVDNYLQLMSLNPNSLLGNDLSSSIRGVLNNKKEALSNCTVQTFNKLMEYKFPLRENTSEPLKSLFLTISHQGITIDTTPVNNWEELVSESRKVAKFFKSTEGDLQLKKIKLTCGPAWNVIQMKLTQLFEMLGDQVFYPPQTPNKRLRTKSLAENIYFENLTRLKQIRSKAEGSDQPTLLFKVWFDHATGLIFAAQLKNMKRDLIILDDSRSIEIQKNDGMFKFNEFSYIDKTKTYSIVHYEFSGAPLISSWKLIAKTSFTILIENQEKIAKKVNQLGQRPFDSQNHLYVHRKYIHDLRSSPIKEGMSFRDILKANYNRISVIHWENQKVLSLVFSKITGLIISINQDDGWHLFPTNANEKYIVEISLKKECSPYGIRFIDCSNISAQSHSWCPQAIEVFEYFTNSLVADC